MNPMPCPYQRPNFGKNERKAPDRLVVSEMRGTYAFFFVIDPGKEQGQRKYRSTVCIGREGPRLPGIQSCVGGATESKKSSGLRKTHSPFTSPSAL